MAMTDLLAPGDPAAGEPLAQLAEENTHLQAELMRRDRFLAFVTHELRSPLTPIVMLSEMIAAEDGLDGDLREAAIEIHANAMLASRLIADLLDLSRATYGKLQYTMAPIDLHEIARHAEAAVRFDADDRGIAFESTLSAAAHRIDGDVDRLTQVILNLLTNSVKFTGEHGSIALRTWNTPDGMIGLAVSDTGIGIDAERVPHLFDPFYQAPEERAAPRHGLGLGLAISRMIVEAHGGSITAHSEGPGRGATFEVLLPVARQEDLP
jgi:signal transduction histidine kinase